MLNNGVPFPPAQPESKIRPAAPEVRQSVRNDRDLTLRRPVCVPPERLGPIVGQWRDCAVLESGPGFGDAGRWSIYAARPRGVFEAMNSSWRIRYEAGTAEAGIGDPLGRLARLIDDLGLSRPDEGADLPFRGGLIGYYGYDLAPRIERLPRRAARESRMPDVRFALYDTAIVVDNSAGTAEFVASDLLGEGRRALERRWEEWDRAIRESAPPAGTAWLKPPRPGLSREAYLAAVGRALEYIRAGDIFQVNLSQRFSCDGVVGPMSQPDPLTIYLRLRTRSPAPFAALLRWKDLAIVSASPELFYETRGRSIVTRPIKGTRPRGEDASDDERLIRELRNSPKDRAELTMIVDLERNDLGRVCEYGSVRVAEPGAIESFAQVHHLVATVEGRLRPDIGPIDIVRAVFPGGSITGAPKIRAMEIIDELEPTRRGVYTGAIGYYGLGGRSAFNIAIRTLLIEGGRVHFQVGGGIVADSDPEAEYEETLHKGRGLRQAAQGAVLAMIWHDGVIHPDDALRVGIDDRVFEHGLGLFETFRSWDGRAPLLGRHLDRLRASAKALGIPLEGVRLPDRQAVAGLVEASGFGGDALLRLTVTGGSDRAPPVAWLTARPLPPPETLPLRVGTRGGYTEPFVHRHKMLNYWGRRRAFERATEQGEDEVLLASPEGYVWEGSRNNLLTVTAGRDRVVETPNLHGPLLPGIMRRVALDFLGERGYAIEERTVNLRELLDAEAVYLTNSVRGVRPVRWIDGRPIRTSCQELTTLLLEELPRHIRSLSEADEPQP